MNAALFRQKECGPLAEFCARFSADFSIASGGRRIRNRTDMYSLEGIPQNVSHPSISAIRIIRFGRFGNNVLQIMQAIHVARKIEAKRIYIGDVNIGNIGAPMRRAGLEFIPRSTPDRLEPVLAGHFYHRFCFAKLFSDFNDAQRIRIMSEYIRPMMAGIYGAAAPHSGNVLHIHIRSGDVFDEQTKVHPCYVQPPVAYYARVIRHAMLFSGISKVVLVFEDRKNPCIDVLINYLSLIPIAFEIQSGSLQEDIVQLARARHIAIGSTSFASLIGVIFQNLETVYGFRNVPFGSLFKAQGVRVFVIRDLAGEYLRVGEWKNTKEQRRQMLDYPYASLAVSE
jgi:hypothetical protein